MWASSKQPVADPTKGQGTTVILQTASDSNARFISFGMTVQTLTLTNKAGVATTIYNSPERVDFVPWNANPRPLAVFTVPRDQYVSATMTEADPWFTYVRMLDNGGILTATDAFGGGPGSAQPVVNLPQPITVDGSEMGMVLSLQQAQSASYTSGAYSDSYTIAPTFALTSFPAPGGLSSGMMGQITAIGAGSSSLTLEIPGGSAFDPQSLDVALNAATKYQGVAGASELAVGMLVRIDATILSNGAYAASRVEVPDKTATDTVSGQIMDWVPSANEFGLTAQQQAGTHLFKSPVGTGTQFEYGNSTSFQISPSGGDLSGVTFSPRFDAGSLVAGQMVSVGATTLSYTGAARSQADTVTLMPQTIDARVLSQSSSGAYTVYAVQLASYDLIVQMNMNPGQYSRATVANASTVMVYANLSNLPNANIAPGQTYRFTGLILNDGGTLRMVCNKVNAGVAF